MKKIISGTLSLILALSMTACSSQKASTVPSQETTSETTAASSPANTETEYDKHDSASILSTIEVRTKIFCDQIAKDKNALIKGLGDSYQSYQEHKDLVSKFYDSVCSETTQYYQLMEQLEVDYLKDVSANGLGEFRVWDKAMSDFYDTWNDSMEQIYKAWDTALDEIYKHCDKLIDLAADNEDFEKYTTSFDEMYDSHSTTWDNLYTAYSDSWTKIYEIHSAVYAGFYEDKTDVDAIIKNYREQKETESATSSSEPSTEPEGTVPIETEESITEPSLSPEPTLPAKPETQPAETSAPTQPETQAPTDDTVPAESEATQSETTVPEQDDSASSNGIRPDFKAAMDSYEAFYDTYCDAMKQVMENPTDMDVLKKYEELEKQADDVEKKLDRWSGDMNTAELNYYYEVLERVTKKITNISF